MEWILAHWEGICFGIMVFDRIATATPENFRPLGIPVGKYDDQIVKVLKRVGGALFGRRFPGSDDASGTGQGPAAPPKG